MFSRYSKSIFVYSLSARTYILAPKNLAKG